MVDMTRRQRQLEYEANLNKWADIGKKRLKLLKFKSKSYTGYPFWYTEFSLLQLQYLNELKDIMFKDKEEKTTFRTLNTLSNIGIITDADKVESRIIKELLNEFNTNPIRFLCEIYRVISGNYFENEKFKYYSCTERIILSGIAFLELPKIILELHKRLPPVLDITLPPKPKPPKAVSPKKMASPYLEKLLMPPDWRAYRKELSKWQKKHSSMVRPVAILPKQVKNARDNKIIKEEDDSMNFIKNMEENHSGCKEEKSCERTNSVEYIENDMNVQEITLNDTIRSNNQDNENTDTYLQESSVIDREKQIIKSYSAQNWTNPLTPCPYKYRKLMDKVGPLNTDEEFFEELGYENQKKCFPAGRENLSVHMQSYLLDLETDLYEVTDDVDKLTCQVKTIAKDILDSEPKCDACCVCRQTQKTHLKLQTTKAPHLIIDSITANTDDKTNVIGALAMHSPASSITSSGEPPCIPSSEKLVTNMIISGTTATIDGERVKQVEGVTKVIEHVPREIILPDNYTVEFKNVPPCKCSEEDPDKEADSQLISREKYTDMCYGRKFRPEEGPAYSCAEFKKKYVVEDDYECAENCEKYASNDECGCGIDFQTCTADDEDEYENSLKSEFEHLLEVRETKEAHKRCKRCGRKVETKCLDMLRKNVNKKMGKLLTDECLCNSLSDFLHFDITNADCRKSKWESGNTIKEEAKLKEIVNKRKMSIKSSSTKISLKEDENEFEDLKVGTDSIKKENLDTDTEIIINENAPLEEKQGGPFGLRTKSEDALSVQRTIAYLVPLHPPNHSADQIPVREGKRPCRCRENRNNRKTLLYNIGGLAGTEKKVQQEDSLPPVIEGVTWLSPEPSIRRSDEYIPEYELYDSPYENLCATSKKIVTKCEGNKTKKSNNETKKCGNETKDVKKQSKKSRSQDWENSFNDPYLTEIFIKKNEKLSCYNKCSKYQKKDEKPRKLRVMNAVCECKTERKIVKRNEDCNKWFKRQSRLKALKKEPFIYISEISRPVLADPESNVSNMTECQSVDNVDRQMKYCASTTAENNMVPPEIVISAVTMQTPVATPVQSTNSSGSSIVPVQNTQIKQVHSTPVEKNLPSKINESQYEPTSKYEFCKDEEMNTLPNICGEQFKTNGPQEVKNNGIIKSNTNAIETSKCFEPQVKPTVKYKRRISFFDLLEKRLKIQIRDELKKMSDEDFVSVKLPSFYKMPQLLYWISYRSKGMNYTDTYKRELTAKSIKKWTKMSAIIERQIGAKDFRVKKKDANKLNFDRAIYWKKRIAEYKLIFYTKLRHEILNLGRDVWSTMEFGKFPDIIFKQAYFTYLPSREKDANLLNILP